MSTNFFEKLKQVNKKSNLIVYGYLRENEKNIFGELLKLNPYYNFPDILNNVCLIYYHITNRWDTKFIGKYHKLIYEHEYENEDGLLLQSDSSYFSSSFGKDIISPTGRYQCKFELLNIPRETVNYDIYWMIILGVWKIKSAESPITDSYWTGAGRGTGGEWTYGYAYDLGAGTLVNAQGTNARLGGQYGKKCKTGDIVEMCLDFDKLTLSFAINGQDMGPSHQNIEATEYRVAVCTGESDVKIKILND